MTNKKKAKTKSRRWPFFVLAMLSMVTVVGGLFWTAQVALVRPLDLNPDGLRFEVKDGSNLSRVVHQLAQDGVLIWPRWSLIYARVQKQTSIHPGEYILPAGSNAMDLVDRLHRGDVTRYRLTLVEGWTFQQALAQVRASSKIASTESGSSPQSAANALGIEGNPEGRIFPDTYIYRSGTTDVELLQQAYARMEKVLAEEWQGRSENLPYKSAYDALIMASMVEKETGAPEERDEIAGVFIRRLQKGMRLQTDPTVIYGLGEKYQGNLRRSHLREATPYNTYVINAMPPTPIALPGREAIHAALHPKPGNALFFVAKGDGTHQFSATLAEHNRAVQQFQLKRRTDYRSSPTKKD